MSYTDSLLAPGERLVRRGRRHWVAFVERAGWALLALAGAGFLLAVRASVPGDNAILGALGYLTLVLVVFGVLSIGWGFLRFRSEEYAVTSLRVIRADGVLNKQATDASLEKITDAILREPFLGRLLGFGSVEILTASPSGLGRLDGLRDAKGFKKAMIEAKHERELEVARPTMPPLRAAEAAESSPPDAPPAPPPMAPEAIVAELRRLADLTAAGELDQASFDERRRELLARL